MRYIEKKRSPAASFLELRWLGEQLTLHQLSVQLTSHKARRAFYSALLQLRTQVADHLVSGFGVREKEEGERMEGWNCKKLLHDRARWKSICASWNFQDGKEITGKWGKILQPKHCQKNWTKIIPLSSSFHSSPPPPPPQLLVALL